VVVVVVVVVVVGALILRTYDARGARATNSRLTHTPS
jgi:hypothetical protein